MSSKELPEFSDAESIQLSPEEIVRFQDEVLLPAVDRKWGGDFINEVVPGAEIKQTVPLYPGQFDAWCTLECGAGIEEDDLDPEESEAESLYINLTISVRKDELLESIKSVYLADRVDRRAAKGYKLKKFRRRLAAELEDEDYTVWEAMVYSFDALGDDGFTAVKRLELKDGDGGTVWDYLGSIDEESDDALDLETRNLNESLSRSLTSEDCFIITDALAALGALPKPA